MTTSLFTLAANEVLDLATKLISQYVGKEVTVREILDYLLQYGYISPAKLMLALVNPQVLFEEFTSAVKDLQKLHGIPETGSLVGPTESVPNAPRCGCSDVQLMSLEELKWGKKTLKWFVRNYLEGIPVGNQEAVIAESWNNWAKVANLSFIRVTSEQDADISIFCQGIDGSGRVLAQAQLPMGGDGRLWLQLDTGELWKLGGSPTGMEILLGNVLTHEMGHNLGLDHSRLSNQLMSPIYAVGVKVPQPEDVQRIQGLYGPSVVVTPPIPVPTPVPPITPTPQPSGKYHLTIEYEGMAVVNPKIIANP